MEAARRAREDMQKWLAEQNGGSRDDPSSRGNDGDPSSSDPSSSHPAPPPGQRARSNQPAILAWTPAPPSLQVAPTSRGKGGVGRAKAAAWALALERKNPAFFAANNINLLRARHWEGHAQGEAR